MSKRRLKVIHVNQHMIKENKKRIKASEDTGGGSVEIVAPITAKPKHGRSMDGFYSNHIDIVDSKDNVVASIVYEPYQQRSCGASVWIETRLKVVNRDNLKETLE